jgi:hypothetical protein
MIRPAAPKDIDIIVELGIESLNNDAYEELIISKEKVREVAIECVSSSSHFSWVSEIDGNVVGAVLAMVFPMQFYERSQCSVIMFYCRVPRSGGFLIRKLFKWYQSRPMLKMLEFTLERNMSPKIADFLTKLGITPELPVHSHFKRPKGKRLF